MKVDELRQALVELGIPPLAYDLDGAGTDECYVLESRGAQWVIYYSERGLRTNERVLDTEDEAATSFLRLLRRDFAR